MVHQDGVQTVCVHPPVLYSTYERKYHETLGEHLSARVIYIYMLWLPTQFEREKKKKWYEKLETSRTLVAPCDARDHARCICESEQNV